MGGMLHLVQRGGAWAGCGPPSPVLAVPNETAHPSTASVPITVLLYDGPLLCGFNLAIKGLTCLHLRSVWSNITDSGLNNFFIEKATDINLCI